MGSLDIESVAKKDEKRKKKYNYIIFIAKFQ